MKKIPTRRSFLRRAGSTLMDALNAKPWLLVIGGFLVFAAANFPT